MDIFGACVIAFVNAYGGGTIRDLLIGTRPINWINDYLALILVISAVIITFLLKRGFNQYRRTIIITDAIGIGMFTVVGIERSLANGINDIYAVLMGVISATFGGLVVDIISNTVPSLLKRGELYATACAIGGGVYMLLLHYPISHDISLVICVLTIVTIRIVSIRKSWQLPEI